MRSKVDYPVLPRLVVQLKDFPKAAWRYVTTCFDRKLPHLTTWKIYRFKFIDVRVFEPL